MSLWIPFTNRGILGGSVLLYLPMPLVVWVEIMRIKQDKEKKTAAVSEHIKLKIKIQSTPQICRGYICRVSVNCEKPQIMDVV